jgi:hypothetical protein
VPRISDHLLTLPFDALVVAAATVIGARARPTDGLGCPAVPAYRGAGEDAPDNREAEEYGDADNPTRTTAHDYRAIQPWGPRSGGSQRSTSALLKVMSV